MKRNDFLKGAGIHGLGTLLSPGKVFADAITAAKGTGNYLLITPRFRYAEYVS